jgi:Ring finger domain
MPRTRCLAVLQHATTILRLDHADRHSRALFQLDPSLYLAALLFVPSAPNNILVQRRLQTMQMCKVIEPRQRIHPHFFVLDGAPLRRAFISSDSDEIVFSASPPYHSATPSPLYSIPGCRTTPNHYTYCTQLGTTLAPTVSQSNSIEPLNPLIMPTAIPSRCLSGFGPSPFPQRTDRCKICQDDIERDQASLTHNESPCFTVFHADCLLSWLPFASHVPGTTDTGMKEPSCPNCRGSLGESDLPISDSDDDDEDDTEQRYNIVLPSFAYPIESLDELRRLVGDDEFSLRPLSARRFPRPIHYSDIPVEQVQAAPLVTAEMQAADAGADFPHLQEQGNFIPSDPRVDIQSIFPVAAQREFGPLPADAVNNFFRANHRSNGVTHYEVFYFCIPGFVNTCFYLPMNPEIHFLPSLNALRERIHARRAFYDPEHPGRWLRNPVIHDPVTIRMALDAGRDTEGIQAMEDVRRTLFETPNNIDIIALEGYALWLPSDISQHGIVYAVPRILIAGPEEGEVISAFLLDNHGVDTNLYWSPFQPCTEEDHDELLHELGSEDDVRRHEDVEVILYDRPFEREMLTFGNPTAPPRPPPSQTDQDELHLYLAGLGARVAAGERAQYNSEEEREAARQHIERAMDEAMAIVARTRQRELQQQRQ